MQKEEDEVYVKGDFIMASYVEHDTFMTAGNLHVSGDLTQKTTGSDRNLATTGGFTLILEGDGIQNVTMEAAHSSSSKIANLIIDNTGEKGVFLNGMLVTGEVTVRRGVPQGELNAVATTVFTDEWYVGDVTFDENTVYEAPLRIKGYLNCLKSFTMKSDLTVEGNLKIGSSFYVNANTLQVSGDINMCQGRIYVGRGKVLCGRNVYLEYRTNSESGFEMSYDEGYVLVEGDVRADASRYASMGRGTLEIKGDFIQGTYDANTAFSPSENFVVILSGDREQTVYFSDSKSRFGTLKLQNKSAEGICSKNDSLRAIYIERNGCRVTCTGKGTYGWTLSEDMILEDDLYIIMDELDLNGHSLTVNGNLYIGAGSVKINGGDLKVSGDLRLQRYDGHGGFSDSNGTLIMEEKTDRVTVEGNFVTQTTKSAEDCLTAGTLEVKGDFSQKKASGMAKNFSPSGTHRVEFTGEKEQIICFEDYINSFFMNVSFTNSGEGVSFSSSATAKGNVEDPRQKVKFANGQFMYVTSLSQFEKGKFGGDVCISASDTLRNDVRIGGTLKSYKDITLKGYALRVGQLEKNDGKLSMNGGDLHVENDMNITANACVIMEDEKDNICVGGDFLMSSKGNLRSNEFSAGKLKINGDVTIQSSGFVPTGTHQTVLSGKTGEQGRVYVQTVNIENADAKFNELVLTKDKDKYYIFLQDVNGLCNKLTLEDNDQEMPSKVTGIQVTKTTATTVRLDWDPSTDNVGIEGYYIFRGSSRIGKTEETSYTDTGLKPAHEYRYTVSAFDKAGNLSEISEPAAAVTESDTKAPDKPQGVKVLTRTGSSVTIAWNKVLDNVGVSTYRIYRDGEVLAEVDGSTGKYKDQGRTPETEHTYRVSALDEAGNESKLSNSIKGVAKMPRIIKVVPENGAELGDDTAVLTAYYENVGNSTGNKVRFEYSTDEGRTWQDINPSLLGQNAGNYSTLYSKYTWDISRFDTMECLVRTTLYDSEGNTDTVETNYRRDTEPPLVPEYLNVESTNGLVELSWSTSDSANCARYEIYRAGENENFVKIQVLKGRGNTEYTDSDVTQEMKYTYYIKAVDDYGRNSEESKKITVTVAKDIESPKVMALSAPKERINKDTVFTIKAVDNIGMESVSLQYFKNNKWNDIGTCEAKNGVGTIRFNTTILKDGEHSFRALAEDRNGNISEGYTRSFIVDNTGVEKIRIGEVTAESDKVRITWEPVSDEDIDTYIVEQLVDGEFVKVASESSTLGAYIKKLDADTEYTFQVVGYDKTGNRGEASEKINITTEKDVIDPYVTKFDPVIAYYQKSIPVEITAKDNNELGELNLSCSLDKIHWKEIAAVDAPSGKREYTYCYDVDISKYDDGKIYIRAVLHDRAGNVNTQAQVIREFYKVNTALDPVKDISAVSRDGYIRVAWEKPTSERFASFDLYRKEENGGYMCVDSETTALNYIDTEGEDNEEVSYKIVVNDLAGNSSGFSKEVKAKVLPDTEDPKVYGVSPVTGSTVSNNPEITALVADNRRLGEIRVEFRKQGGGDLWTEIYREKTDKDNKYAKITWENEDLDEGTYEFRVYAQDSSENASGEYGFSYVYDRDYKGSGDNTGGNLSGGGVEIPLDPEGEKEPEKEKPAAVLPAEYSVRQGAETTFDGSNSTSGTAIVSWKWDFGNGDTSKGARVNYAYQETGTYKLKLTVKDADGNEDSVTSSVQVLSKSCGGVSVSVKEKGGTPLGGAQVYIQKNSEKEGKLYNCDIYGGLEVALDAGTYKVSAYQSGHIPLEKEVKINPGTVKKLDFALEANELITGTLTHRKLDVREIMELGIDLSDPDNWYTYTYAVVTYRRKEPEPKVHNFYVSQGNWTYVGVGGGKRVAYTVARDENEDVEILVRYETVEYLKQMFEVELRLQNQAAKEFTVTNGVGTLQLPEGLSLAGMIDRKQEETVEVPDIPGQSEQAVTWYIRGDEPGEYYISAGYNGRLQPFDAPINVTIYDKEAITVTAENTNTNTDDGFLDPDKKTRNYQIEVEDLERDGVKGAYVEMEHNGLSTRGITDSDGFVWLEVNEGDTRTFHLTVKCDRYKNYEDTNYKIEGKDYMDEILIVPEGQKSYEDENDGYKGNFTLDYVLVNGLDVSQIENQVEINAYETDQNTVRLYFSENVSKASIVIKGKGENNYVKIVEETGISSTEVTLKFNSNTLTKDYKMYVEAVDEKSKSWHSYRLDNVSIVYEEFEPEYVTEHYNQKLAEQCALYSALAYKVIKKEDGKTMEGFSFDTNTNFLSDRMDETYEPENKECLELGKKLSEDGFVTDDKYMYVNYFEKSDDEDAENNCSYSIVHKEMCNGKKMVYVIIRGTDRVEWLGNMRITGESYDASQEYHSNFKYAEGAVYKNVKKYIEDNNFKNADIVVTGHSRGAAVANLLAKDLIDGKEEFNGNKRGSYDNVTAYTFATPYVSCNEDVNSEEYNNIFNFCFSDDFVPQVPMKSWGYGKYGQTVFANAETLSQINPDFTRVRLKIRSEDKDISYASDKTEELILHISENWNNISDYYNSRTYKNVENEIINPTLYQFMHDKVATAIVERKNKKLEEFLAKVEILIRAFGSNRLSTVARYFLNGSELLDNYIFDTHHIDNYYSALLSGGFDTSELNSSAKTKSMTKKYLSSTNVDNDATDSESSGDITALKKVLQNERDVYNEDGEVNKMPIYKILGWDIDDTSTWKGIIITDGDVTSIDLPPVCLGGELDLSGFDKLESLECIYTGFEEIKLSGCTSLKKLVLCDNAITSIDLSDCDKLEYVNVSNNELKSICWGSYDSLIRFNCTGNYLDTDTDVALLSVIAAVKEKGFNPLYKSQRYDENAEFSQDDIAFVKTLLTDGDNEELLGWDKDDISTWSGIQWKIVGGMNYINRIDIPRKGLTGELTVSNVKYVREIICGGNKFTSLDVSGCSALEQLNCFSGELETLILSGNDKLLYLDCRNNFLMKEDIESECKKIASREGSEVYYERQYINARCEAFCEDECEELERFASLSENKDILKWDLSKPGRIPSIEWEVRDGEYRVKEIDLSGYGVEGTLDLSGFSALKSVDFAVTKISGVILPEQLEELPDKTFISCHELEEVKLPSSLKYIGKNAFYNCEKLNRIDFPDSLKEIQEEAFTNCKGLTEITFGKNLGVLGDHVFAGCTSLIKVTFPGNAPDRLGSDIFYGTPDEFIICYYRAYSGWDGEYWSKYRLVCVGDIGELPSEIDQPSLSPEKSPEPDTTNQPMESPEPSTTNQPMGPQESENPGMPSVPEEGDGKVDSSSPTISNEMPTTSKENISGDSKNFSDKKIRINKVKIQKCKLKKQVLKITLKKDKKVSGYEVFYRKGKKGKFKLKWQKGWKKNQITLRGLKKNSYYYIKARAYKVVEGKKYYSAFTNCRRIKIK